MWKNWMSEAAHIDGQGIFISANIYFSLGTPTPVSNNGTDAMS
jgi:hypothetical protein